MIAVTTTRPITSGMSPWRGGGDGDLAEAGDREDLLHDHRAAEQADELHGEDGERGAAGVAQHVLVDDAAGREPAAAEGAHVVLAERVDHRAADLLR